MAGLTAAVKLKANITWTSEETEAKLADIMSRAEYMLNDLLGTTLVYDDEELKGRERDLYLNLCLYLYNELPESEFLDAYKEPLRMARIHYVSPVNTEDEDEDE